MQVAGDLVLKKQSYSHTKNNLSPNWVGPQRVLRVIGRGAYELETLGGKLVPRTWKVRNLCF